MRVSQMVSRPEETWTSLETQSHARIHSLDSLNIRLEVTGDDCNKYPGP